MSNIMKHFETLTKIPHCSKAAGNMTEFLTNFARNRGYTVEVDGHKNILAKKGKPVICLQSHYDMVCVGRAPDIKTRVKDGWMDAEDSSLGADNGIGVAMMMEIMETGEETELLFTADEEVGLIGATHLDFTLDSKYMLNLDSEDEGEVYIGCAGGADITATKTYNSVEGEGEWYEITIDGLPGGHSGLAIHKNIPSSVKLICEYLLNNGVEEIHSLEAGERRNTIPKSAKAIVRSIKALEDTETVKAKKTSKGAFVAKSCAELLETLNDFRHGVWSFNEELGIPEASINLAIVSLQPNGNSTVTCAARGMSTESLKDITEKSSAHFESKGHKSMPEYKYPAWTPEISHFTEKAGKEIEAVFGSKEYKAVHAGLECGLIAERYPEILFASIGPNIRNAHTTRETVEINSVEKTFKAVKAIVEGVNALRGN